MSTSELRLKLHAHAPAGAWYLSWKDGIFELSPSTIASRFTTPFPTGDSARETGLSFGHGFTLHPSIERIQRQTNAVSLILRGVTCSGALTRQTGK
jgi:hypothetical protein